jgi:hypothetical protein
MQPPQFLLDLLQLLLDLAAPAAFCTLAAAGVSLRHEGGINFHVDALSGLELQRPVRGDRHAYLPLELHRRTDIAGRGRAGVCRIGHQLRPIQTLDPAGLRGDLLPERERPSIAVPGDGGVRTEL